VDQYNGRLDARVVGHEISSLKCGRQLYDIPFTSKMPFLTNDSDRDWERLGQTDPYFAVLTAPEYHGDLSDLDRETFFASGEAHVARVLSIIQNSLDPAFAPERALDFGCGVGRILIPLSGRCREVVGVDVSAGMLAKARENCNSAGASNVQLLPSDDQLTAVVGEFDFVHSYIVLQHIPVRRGERLVQELVSRLAPNGIGVFHVSYARAATTSLRRLVYWARTHVPGAHWALNLALGRPARASLMQMNRYSVTRLLDILWRNGCSEVHVRFSDHGGYRGVLLFAKKAPAELFL
jgi:SAM-dependent methyltransferase